MTKSLYYVDFGNVSAIQGNETFKSLTSKIQMPGHANAYLFWSEKALGDLVQGLTQGSTGVGTAIVLPVNPQGYQNVTNLPTYLRDAIGIENKAA